MKCPVDNEALVMSDRQGVEIDYCPTCRGVWLDRGELDKIIERSDAHSAPAPKAYDAKRREEPRRLAPYDRHKNDTHHHGHKKKRENFLGELFDF
jgi:Zn-finger nucleic acid-binding protein